MLPEPKVWGIKQVSHYLGIHQSTLYRMLRRGEITAYKIGADWRFNIEDVERWRLNHPLGKTATGIIGHKPRDPNPAKG
jgi:excisionase family DNA binding protein